jgi:hypothetical protein
MYTVIKALKILFDQKILKNLVFKYLDYDTEPTLQILIKKIY